MGIFQSNFQTQNWLCYGITYEHSADDCITASCVFNPYSKGLNLKPFLIDRYCLHANYINPLESFT